ncbi:MAG: helix-turn-helix domain-containing protein [Oscillospiraceae bacterium]|nr:helix-turn-helix domain-containing protein [Oscillospiraceae bacterium]
MVGFGERMKILRKEKNLTQVNMAKFLGCTEHHYQKIEYGKINIPSKDLVAIADYFDVSIDWLVGRSEIRERR